MKNTSLLLCLTFSTFSVLAQSTLKIGDNAPSLDGIEKWIKGTPVKQFKKGDVYVMEFGATWCTPCAAAIPHLTSLAEQYPGQVTIISNFVLENYAVADASGKPAYAQKVERYVAKRQKDMNYSVALDGQGKVLWQNWLGAANRVGVPHAFIIDKQGRIAWVGNPMGLDSVLALVVNDRYHIENKTKPAEPNQAAKEINNDSSREIIYLSGLSKYRLNETPFVNSLHIDNFRYGTTQDLIDRQGKIEVQGESLRRLYYMAYGDTLWNYPYERNPITHQYRDTIAMPHYKRAYGKYWYKPLLRVKDSTVFDRTSRSPVNRYDYIFQAPLNKASSRFLQHAMQRDMELYFDYKASVEMLSMPCWYIKTNSKAIHLKCKTPKSGYQEYEDNAGNFVFKNAEVRDIIQVLEASFGQSLDLDLKERPNRQPPLFDTTGLTEPIDFTLDGKLMERVYSHRGDPELFRQVRAMLSELGFELVQGRRLMKVVVVRDRSN